MDLSEIIGGIKRFSKVIKYPLIRLGNNLFVAKSNDTTIGTIINDFTIFKDTTLEGSFDMLKPCDLCNFGSVKMLTIGISKKSNYNLSSLDNDLIVNKIKSYLWMGQKCTVENNCSDCIMIYFIDKETVLDLIEETYDMLVSNGCEEHEGKYICLRLKVFNKINETYDIKARFEARRRMRGSDLIGTEIRSLRDRYSLTNETSVRSLTTLFHLDSSLKDNEIYVPKLTFVSKQFIYGYGDLSEFFNMGEIISELAGMDCSASRKMSK
jgi:hypothetical protein